MVILSFRDDTRSIMKQAFVFLVLFSFQSLQAQVSDILEPDSSLVDDSSIIDDRQQRRLKKEQVRIKRMEKRAEKDGKVTAREKKKINHAQKRASRSISKKKHNKR